MWSVCVHSRGLVGHIERHHRREVHSIRYTSNDALLSAHAWTSWGYIRVECAHVSSRLHKCSRVAYIQSSDIIGGFIIQRDRRCRPPSTLNCSVPWFSWVTGKSKGLALTKSCPTSRRFRAGEVLCRCTCKQTACCWLCCSSQCCSSRGGNSQHSRFKAVLRMCVCMLCVRNNYAH